MIRIAAFLLLWLSRYSAAEPTRPRMRREKSNTPQVTTTTETTTTVPLASALSLYSTRRSESTHCGCNECTDAAWNTMAGDHTCGARVTYLQSSEGGSYSEAAACSQIGGTEFPTICGPYCDPSRCGQSPPVATVSPTYTPGPQTASLYCFPDEGSRTTYSNVWGKYQVEVKEGVGCGPSDNTFSPDTVAVSGNELTLSYKMVNDVWEASEVRILLPADEMPFIYGTYSFGVKSVSVINSDSTVVANSIPDDLILGLFTWDNIDRYDVHQNYNHEVDIEMSKWGDPYNEDMQFLVQPPIDSLKKRFFSGTSATDLAQSGQTHSFTWLPGILTWASTAGGGQTFSYTTESAIESGQTDYVQCLPANLEVRINIWNMNGSATPSGMTNGQRFEVVVDDFTFTPSSASPFVAPGGHCSKHCMCEEEFGCVNSKCIALS